MPPKIKGMTKQITLLLSGDDQLSPEIKELAPKALPHERFLLGETFPLAAALSKPKQNEILSCIEPVHMHATRDHLVLLPLQDLQVSNEEILTLMNEARTVFMEEGLGDLIQLDHLRWASSHPTISSLYTHSIYQTKGRNIDWWLPKDTNEIGIAKRWRKIQNEVQMRWHIHPVNEARDANGLPTINSIWLYGVGKSGDCQYPSELINASQMISDQAWMELIAQRLGIPFQYPDSLVWENLSEHTFIWVNDAQKIWSELSSWLSQYDLTITVIDFPKLVRKRIFKSSDYQQSSWKFWRHKEPPTWAEIQA